ncbi:T9SS type A sorting domain-containing protein [uncultured Winogradskyella sp.]|uniref:T9SS type A sorting domain-containing protein n=1 Tax=uncultured Winogradskyella sp. TaxID=395353 RepID=UPI0030D9692E|tara:strand:+ start:4997 stop:6634 length:1638 start_codon:yes stop_codon:yes gene_type:complete
MKKITFLLMLFAVTLGYSQSPDVVAATPTELEADVISIFSGAYTDVAGSGFNPNWGQSGFGSANTAFDVVGSGDLALEYSNWNYQGTDIGADQNLTGMVTLHLDIWTNGESPNVFLISRSTGERSVNVPSSPGVWTSVEIPLSDYTSQGLGITDIFQFKYDGGNGAGTIYIDNIYFSKPPTDPNTDATLSDLQVDGATISGFASGATTYTYELVVGTTTPLDITSTTTTEAGANAVITQATTVPGDATVVVTASNGTDMQTYTVSFVATLPGIPPTPASPDAEVLALLSDITDTGGFTNFWNPTYYFGSNIGTPDLDPTAGVSKVVKMDFSTAGWGGGINTGADVYTDVSAYGFLNFSYFAVDEPAGVNGHEVKFILIGGGAGPSGGGGEFSYTMKETGNGGDGDLVFGSWENVSVPLSHFVGLGWATDNFFQFKLGSTSDLNTKTVYFDNMYFSVNAGTVLNVNDFELGSVNIYPNPTNTVWNIKTNNQNIKTVQVFDILGKQVITLTPNSTEVSIDASGLNDGIYLAKVTSNNSTITVKLVKN